MVWDKTVFSSIVFLSQLVLFLLRSFTVFSNTMIEYGLFSLMLLTSEAISSNLFVTLCANLLNFNTLISDSLLYSVSQKRLPFEVKR